MWPHRNGSLSCPAGLNLPFSFREEFRRRQAYETLHALSQDIDQKRTDRCLSDSRYHCEPEGGQNIFGYGLTPATDEREKAEL